MLARCNGTGAGFVSAAEGLRAARCTVPCCSWRPGARKLCSSDTAHTSAEKPGQWRVEGPLQQHPRHRSQSDVRKKTAATQAPDATVRERPTFSTRVPGCGDRPGMVSDQGAPGAAAHSHTLSAASTSEEGRRFATSKVRITDCVHAPPTTAQVGVSP